jgi:BirA family biotin operon repressor/biotin-[acetyl-CoA-carboxylase] ligase
MANDDLAGIANYEPGTRIIGKSIIYLPVTTSTNEVAKQAAKDGAVEGTVIIAGQQTAGRGRLERSWVSPEGVLALSIVLRPQSSSLNRLIMVSSLAVVHAINDVTSLETQIKWPNDILIRGKKVSGILIENGWKGRTLSYAVIGIGININFSTADYPEIAETATNLSSELNKPVSIDDVARAVLVALDRYYSSYDVFTEWRDRLITLNHFVTVTSGKTVIKGRAESVDRDGCLLIRQDSGELTKVSTGYATLRG